MFSVLWSPAVSSPKPCRFFDFRLTNIPGYVSVDMDGNFVCAADLDKIVVWNSKNGKLIRVIPIVPHYNSREDPLEAQDRYCWKGIVKHLS